MMEQIGWSGSRSQHSLTDAMRNGLRLLMLTGVLGLAGCASSMPAPVDLAMLTTQVADTERAFADTMARRDHAAFGQFLADDTIFIAGEVHLRGKEAVMASWKSLYEAAPAPFSWAPDYVEVQASGLLALSSGPVRDPTGKIVSRFSSIWRQEVPGVWRIIFDQGNPVCDPPTP